MQVDETLIRNVVEQVVARISTNGNGSAAHSSGGYQAMAAEEMGG